MPSGWLQSGLCIWALIARLLSNSEEKMKLQNIWTVPVAVFKLSLSTLVSLLGCHSPILTRNLDLKLIFCCSNLCLSGAASMPSRTKKNYQRCFIELCHSFLSTNFFSAQRNLEPHESSFQGLSDELLMTPLLHRLAPHFHSWFSSSRVDKCTPCH